MKIHRISIKNFGGVAASEVALAPVGVTILQGANEVGKSTLMQAVNLLLEYADNSGHADVRAAKPTHLDAGAEVEAELEVGPYRFTYRKRFHRDRETQLTIHVPTSESLTGREAHDRVTAILEESIDVSLWRALRITQDAKADLPTLKGQMALTTALDLAAGTSRTDDNEESLFGMAQNEYEKYFTVGGREREPIVAARTRDSTAAVRVQELTSQLTALETDIQTHASLILEIDGVKRSLPSLLDGVTHAKAACERIGGLQREVSTRNTAVEAANAMAVSAAAAVAERDRLIEAASSSESLLRVQQDAADTTKDAQGVAELELSAAKQLLAQSAVSASRSEEDANLRRLDRVFRHDELEAEQLKERLGRYKRAVRDGNDAAGIVASTTLTERLRKEIRENEVEVRTSEELLKTQAPRVELKALKAIEVKIAGKAMKLPVGKSIMRPVSESVPIIIDEVAQCTFTPGAGGEALQVRLNNARTTLKSACARAGVNTPEQAESLWSALVDARRTVNVTKSAQTEALRDLTAADLEEKAQNTAARVKAYKQGRTSTLELPENLSEAKAFETAAEKAKRNAVATRSAAEAALEQVNSAFASASQAAAVAKALLEQKAADVISAEGRLNEARTVTSDSELKSAADETARKALDARNHRASAQQSLQQANPESAHDLMEAAISAHDDAHERLGGLEQKQIALRTRLDLNGERGLAEELALAGREAFESDDALRRVSRRAAAAKLLFETMDAARTIARRAYVAPLRDGVERLGRTIWGPTFVIEIDEDLTIVNRTLNGISVPYASLSNGAKEQMGVLMRLAAAAIVSKNGGVPLVLDDALSSTDPERLQAMGAILSVASREGQTIVLTCFPEHYAHVATARRIRIDRA